MEKSKVKLIISRNDGFSGVLERVVIVEKLKTAYQTRKSAELQFLNDYAGRDLGEQKFDKISKAKEFCGLSIKSKVL